MIKRKKESVTSSFYGIKKSKVRKKILFETLACFICVDKMVFFFHIYLSRALNKSKMEKKI